MEHVHPTLIEAMKPEAECWKIGQFHCIITTASGSLYHVDSDGTLLGGTHLTEDSPGELHGAVYRRGGPIRVGYIAVGLCIEAFTSDEKVLVTSPVESITVVDKLVEAG